MSNLEQAARLALAMAEQDWLDAEPFFDEAEQENLSWSRFKYVLQKHGLPPGRINDELLAALAEELTRPR